MSMQSIASAPGKIILSGEYAVVFGYPGLAIPSSATLTVSYEPSDAKLMIEWPEKDVHPAWLEYAQKIIGLLEDQTSKKYGGTIRIENQLPLGKGMGSSTALVIAITKSLASATGAPEPQLRGLALQIENTVNPGHSGIDFNTIWGGKPILFQKGEPPVEAYLSLDFLKNAVLIDTGKPDQTTKELVAWMKTREAEVEPTLERIAACTVQFLEGDDPMQIIREHHRAQTELGVVPEKTQKLIDEIEKGGGAAKVIGAGGRTGGGGMVLTIGIHPKKIETIAQKQSMKTYSL